MTLLVQPRNGTRFRPVFNDATAFREAVSVWLDSRYQTVRDIVWIRMPRSEHGVTLADFIVFAKGRVYVIALLAMNELLGAERERLAHLFRILDHDYRIVRAETPAHAVTQLSKMITGEEPE